MEDRLGELVRVVDYLEEKPVPSANSLIVRKESIAAPLDWYDVIPPYLLAQDLDLEPQVLLGLVFARLDNYERVYHYLADVDPALTHELDIYNRLRHGLHIDAGDLPSSLDHYDEYRLMHNHAVIRHYGVEASDHEATKYYYLQALECAPTDEHRAYSARQFGMFLTDRGELEDATRVLQVGLASAESEEAKAALRYNLSQARLQLLEFPYDAAQLEAIKGDLWAALQVFERQERPLETALTLVDAATVAQYDESWSEGLGYISRAISLLEGGDVPGLLADAQLRRGGLLYAWAQNGNPQFYRKAAEAYQMAARTFTREEAPLIYADLQQRLGLVYAEVPDEVKKKGMWAAMSSSAFQEALKMVDREEHPQLYASICNHYGNALIKYPEAKLTDNAEKALYYFQEALDVRPAETMPLSRALTLLNYLEAQWHRGMPEDAFDNDRYLDMEARAREVIAIAPDPELTKAAQDHLDKLALLRLAYAG